MNNRMFGAVPGATAKQINLIKACVKRAGGSQILLAKKIQSLTGHGASQNLISRTIVKKRISTELALVLPRLFPELVSVADLRPDLVPYLNGATPCITTPGPPSRSRQLSARSSTRKSPRASPPTS
jgi:hypothetical protein